MPIVRWIPIRTTPSCFLFVFAHFHLQIVTQNVIFWLSLCTWWRDRFCSIKFPFLLNLVNVIWLNLIVRWLPECVAFFGTNVCSFVHIKKLFNCTLRTAKKNSAFSYLLIFILDTVFILCRIRIGIVVWIRWQFNDKHMWIIGTWMMAWWFNGKTLTMMTWWWFQFC